MIGWLDPLSGLAGAVLTIAAVVGLFWRPIHRAGRVLRAVEGEPQRPGLMAQMRHQSERLEVISHQVLPNGGASMRDQIGRVETCAAATAAQSAATAERVQTLAERLDRHIENGAHA